MKTISKHIRVSAFSLVLPAVFNAFSPSAYASLVDISQSQAYGSKPSALGSVGAGQEPLVASFQTAAVHFITSPRNGNQFNGGSSQIVQDFTSEGLCANAGYHIISCPNGYIKGDACPEDKRFVRECIEPERWCRDNGYAITKCEAPNYPETVCPYSGAYYRSCKTDNIRACKEAGYSLTCETGMLGDNAQVCPYNSSYKKCVCNPCLGFDYTDDQANAQGYLPGEVCNSCGNLKYKRTTNPCDGFMECKNGGTVGAEVCFSGSIKKFSLCDDGCDPNVFKYDQNNCNGDYTYCAGSSWCGGKSSKCIKKLYHFPDPFIYQGLKFVYDPKECNNYAAGGFYDELVNRGEAKDFDNAYRRCRSNGEIECIKLIDEFRQKGEVSLNKDYDCGFERFEGTGKIHGNGHTITFDRPFGGAFRFNRSDDVLELDRVTIINKATNFQAEGLGDNCCQSLLTCSEQGKQRRPLFDSLKVKLTDVKIISDFSIGDASTIYFYGSNEVEQKGWLNNWGENYYVKGRLQLKRPDAAPVSSADLLKIRVYEGGQLDLSGHIDYKPSYNYRDE